MIPARLALFLLAAAPGAVGAQEPGEPVVVDRVVAVVGNRPILYSQVEEQVFTLQAEGRPLPSTPDGMRALRLEVLADLIDTELLVQQAQRDTAVKVTDQQVVDAVEQIYRRIRKNLPSDLDFREELRKAGFQTPEEHRRWLSDQQRRELLQNAMVQRLREQGHLKPVPPTEAEMREFFEEQKGQLGTRPATISFKQIVITPRAKEGAKQVARLKADSIAKELRQGADFATAARRFSMDPGSREQGGSLNWMRRGPPLDPAFEAAAFSLRPGVISNPVETVFGYHIIQVERVQPTEVQARHILIMPDITEEDRDSARALATRIRDAVLAGASFDSLQRVYHDQAEEKEAQDFPVNQLPPGYRDALADADSGSVPPLIELPAEDNRGKFVVLRMGRRVPEGQFGFDDLRERIRQILSERLAVRRYLDRLKKGTYVDIRVD